ncbi:MAG: NUDIX hydrolase [Alphaproteobacteria bacterium]|nr:NUDIX hydrolase [Alphaproteobacteria bacterium]
MKAPPFKTMNEIKPHPQVAARALVVHDRRLLLVREKSGFWTMPGGRSDYGEDIRACARREAWEETGLHIEIEEIFAISEFYYPARDFHVVQTLFYARLSDDVILPPSWTDRGGMVQERRFFSLAEVRQLDEVSPVSLKDGHWLTGMPCDPLYLGMETKE